MQRPLPLLQSKWFYVALLVLLSSAFYITASLFLIIPFYLLFFLLSNKEKLLALILLSLTLFLIPHEIKSGKQKEALLEITSITPSANYYAEGLLYKGVLKDKKGKSNVQFFLPHHPKKERLSANHLYKIEGKVKKKGEHHLLTLKKHEPLSSIFSLAEQRFIWKQQLKDHLSEKIQSKEAAAFLTALFTGEFLHKELGFHLTRTGLSHLLAISGFHFAMLSLFLSTLLRRLFSVRISLVLLLTLLTLYLLFLGPIPSVFRAYLSVTILIIGQLFNYTSSSVSRLFFALLIVLLYDPYSFLEKNVVFSFSATLGILLFFSPLQHLFYKTLPLAPFKEIQKAPFFTQLAALLIAFLRESVALTLSINLFLFPVMLYYFHSFPLLSLLYNLFIPTFVIISMGLLFTALLCDMFLPFLSPLIYACNTFYTESYLHTTTHIPSHLHQSLHYNGMTPAFLIAYFSFMIFCGLLLTRLSKESAIVKFI